MKKIHILTSFLGLLYLQYNNLSYAAAAAAAGAHEEVVIDFSKYSVLREVPEDVREEFQHVFRKCAHDDEVLNGLNQMMEYTFLGIYHDGLINFSSENRRKILGYFEKIAEVVCKYDAKGFDISNTLGFVWLLVRPSDEFWDHVPDELRDQVFDTAMGLEGKLGLSAFNVTMQRLIVQAVEKDQIGLLDRFAEIYGITHFNNAIVGNNISIEDFSLVVDAMKVLRSELGEEVHGKEIYKIVMRMGDEEFQKTIERGRWGRRGTLVGWGAAVL